ncbi:CopD family protein [Thermithiobacillus plumbiphilus]|uniref:CopD family protein n=1 Tax=Thermithiobacillus plumbiphilus TaxID=1729899 RepID=A0ABU9D861_9PROT
MSAILMLLSLWLHVASIVVWLGGMTFFVLVLMSVARTQAYRALAPALIERIGLRFRTVAWFALGVLVLSGISNLYLLGASPAALLDSRFWQSPPGRLLEVKLSLISVILILSVVHDFYIGPRSMTLTQADKITSPESERLRRQAMLIGRVNFLLALMVLVLGLMLGHGFFPFQG